MPRLPWSLVWLAVLPSVLAETGDRQPNIRVTERDQIPQIGVYTCPEPDWQPFNRCRWQRMDSDDQGRGGCFSFEDKEHSDQLSFGPDKGTWCYVFTQRQCGGTPYRIDYPGTPNLGKFGLANGNADWASFKISKPQTKPRWSTEFWKKRKGKVVICTDTQSDGRFAWDNHMSMLRTR